MPKASVRTAYKKFLLKHEYIQLELEEHEQELAMRKEKFAAAYNELYEELPEDFRAAVDAKNFQINQVPTPTPDDAATTNPEDATRSDLKNLYKRIARETHPDKYECVEDKEIKEEKAKLFQQAKEFYEEGNWVELQRIAKRLEIKIPKPTPNQVRYIKDSIQSMQDRIKEIVETTAWKWYDCPDDQKEPYMVSYFHAVLEHPS